jgi:hypothetical protein
MSDQRPRLVASSGAAGASASGWRSVDTTFGCSMPSRASSRCASAKCTCRTPAHLTLRCGCADTARGERLGDDGAAAWPALPPRALVRSPRGALRRLGCCAPAASWSPRKSSDELQRSTASRVNRSARCAWRSAKALSMRRRGSVHNARYDNQSDLCVRFQKTRIDFQDVERRCRPARNRRGCLPSACGAEIIMRIGERYLLQGLMKSTAGST